MSAQLDSSGLHSVSIAVAETQPASASRGRPAKPHAKHSWLLPREHGAYAEVLFPLTAALLMGNASAGALFFAVSTICAFLLHEPVSVLLGRRGDRARRELGERAAQRTLVLGTLILASGVLGLGMAVQPTARVAFLLLIPIAMLLSYLMATKTEKTIPGELLIAAVSGAVAVPVALAGDVSLPLALQAALCWGIIFAMGTLAVHAILRRARRKGTDLAWSVVGLAMVMLVTSCTFNVVADARWLLGLVPCALVVLALLATGVTPQRLKVVGWSLVVSNLVTLWILIASQAS